MITMNNEYDLKHWLNTVCPDDGKQVNLVNFHGGKWFVPDNLRSQFLEYYTAIFLKKRIQHFNFIAYEKTWLVHPYLDVDFPRLVDFEFMLSHRNIDASSFYQTVIKEFGDALGVTQELIPSSIEFFRKPHETHKFHLVCKNSEYVMTKSEMMQRIWHMARNLHTLLNLADFEHQPMQKEKKVKNETTLIDLPWSHTCPIENIPTSNVDLIASFVDVTAPGIRPIGSGKAGERDFNQTYQLMEPSTDEIIMISQADELDSHMIAARGNDNNRKQRDSFQQKQIPLESLTEVKFTNLFIFLNSNLTTC